jgi:transaldolase
MKAKAVECDLQKSGRDGGDSMKATRILHDLGQSLWLDNITRNLLKTGVLRRYIDEFSVTGLTSNPTIFDHAIKNSGDYDDAIKTHLGQHDNIDEAVHAEDATVRTDNFTYWRTNSFVGFVLLRREELPFGAAARSPLVLRVALS